jgi:hypothetical protein
MDEVDVDAVGPKPLEARLDGIPDVAAEAASSASLPKDMVPKQREETLTPVFPRNL